MKRINIPSTSPLANKVGISPAVRKGSFISTSGCAPLNDDGTTAHQGDLYNQTKACIEIMKQSIEEAGASLEDVVKTRVYLTDVSKWEDAFKAYGECFSNIKPACLMCEVKGFINPEWLVEVEADCVIGDE